MAGTSHTTNEFFIGQNSNILQILRKYSTRLVGKYTYYGLCVGISEENVCQKRFVIQITINY